MSSAPRRARHGGDDDLRELSGASDRPCRNYRVCYSTAEPRLPIRAQQAFQLDWLELVQDVCRGSRLTRVHSHVERAVETKGEASRWRVDLRGRHAEIEEHADKQLIVQLGSHDAPHLVKAGMREMNSVSKSAEPDSGSCDGCRILIDTDKPKIGSTLKKRGRVTSSAKRRVKNRALGNASEELDDLVEHRRCVLKALARPQPPGRRRTCLSFISGMESGGER